MTKEIIAYHGWGFSASFWNGWQKNFSAEWMCEERGYFSPETKKSVYFQKSDSEKMVFAHSLGLHFIPEEVWESLDLLVIFSSFSFFHEENVQQTKRVLFLMQKELKRDAKSLLRKFYFRCGQAPFSEELSINSLRLQEDLEFLDRHALPLSLLRKCKKVMIFHGEKDHIVSFRLGESLHRQIPNSHFICIPGAGHVLHAEEQKKCIPYLANFFQKPFKERIKENFSKASLSYSSSACFAALAVKKLMELFSWVKNTLPDGPLLEIGAGTGFVSQKLLPQIPSRKYILSDLSSSMIEQCQKNLRYNPELVSFCLMDGEKIEEKEQYSLILSGMVLQWFENIEGTLHQWFNALKKDGKLLFSFLAKNSFIEWEALCKEYGLPLTKNSLPEIATIKRILLSLDPKAYIEEQTFSIPYPNLRAFFHNLKAAGAHTSQRKQMTWKERKKLLLLCRKTEKINISYQIGYALVKKNEFLS